MDAKEPLMRLADAVVASLGPSLAVTVALAAGCGPSCSYGADLALFLVVSCAVLSVAVEIARWAR